MVYTEIKNRNGKTYYYRVLSIREGSKFSKRRNYLGVDLSKEKLKKFEERADEELLAEKRQKIKNNIEKIKSKIIPLLRKNKIKRAGIFGSYVRGEQRKNSDIDILIEPPKNRKFSLLDLVALERMLKEKMGIKVDLITYSGIYHLLRSRILNEEVRII